VRLPCVFVGSVPLFPVASDKQSQFLTAFAKARGKFKTAKRDHENLGFQAADKRPSRYADLASVHDACMDALNSLGLSVMHFTVPICNDVYLLTRIAHESGEWIQAAFPLTTLDSVRQSIADAAKDIGQLYCTRRGCWRARRRDGGAPEEKARPVCSGAEVDHIPASLLSLRARWYHDRR
jgi:hypothetical protein